MMMMMMMMMNMIKIAEVMVQYHHSAHVFSTLDVGSGPAMRDIQSTHFDKVRGNREFPVECNPTHILGYYPQETEGKMMGKMMQMEVPKLQSFLVWSSHISMNITCRIYGLVKPYLTHTFIICRLDRRGNHGQDIQLV